MNGTEQLTGIVGWTAGLVGSLGPVGVGLAVALENLFPPIPSEVVLPLAGFEASRGSMSVVAAIVAATLGSVIGAFALYGLGRWLGLQRITHLWGAIPLTEDDDIDRAVGWFKAHGSAAVFVARMVPVVRSAISVPAGVAGMPLLRFGLLTLLGSAIWNTVFIELGYVLGSRWDNIGAYSAWLDRGVLLVVAAGLAWVILKRLRRQRM